jgi:hypothetical protein
VARPFREAERQFKASRQGGVEPAYNEFIMLLNIMCNQLIKGRKYPVARGLQFRV